jgi:type IV pilus assembly protein PilV
MLSYWQRKRRAGTVMQPQRGAALLEVLIAVLVMSIGLLSLASLQVNSLRFNHSAYLRSQATNLAYDIVDRMRANRDAARLGTYSLALNATPPTDATVASEDLQQWRTQLAALLPGGVGAVRQIGGDIVEVEVLWDDTRGAATVSFVFRTRL